MSLASAFAPVEALNREIVKFDTWGHLAPEPHKKYHGWIIVAIGEYGETIVLQDDFPGLPNSPWQYNDLCEFTFEATGDFEVGLYKFKGWYKKFKNGNFRFGGGKWRRVEI